VGVRDYTDGRDGKNAFFSVNGSQLLLQFNNEFSGATKINPNDTADYVVSDVFGTGSPGDSRTLSSIDIANMNVLGWTPVDITAPSLTHDSTLTVAYAGTSTITSSVLQFDDNVSTHAQETYTIVTAPAHGTLLKSGSATTSFTQTDIDNGLISYHENGSVASSDSFVFKVTDAAGNQTTAQQFQFQISPPPDTAAPTLIHDGPLVSPFGSTLIITSSLLQFDDNNSTHPQETYTIVTGSARGTLLKSGSATTSFTQADIDNGLISYHETASGASADSFVFSVSDASGNHTANTTFQITIDSARVRDFNADATSDVFWRNNSTGHVGTWEMHNNVQTWHDLGGSGVDHKVVGIGDFNGDGTSDVFWRNNSNGRVGIWEMHNNVQTWHDLGGSGVDHSFIV
jgi:hypothetical protein